MAKQQVYQFDNGASLIYQKQTAFNGYSFAIGFRCGAQLDGKYKGLSHLLEHLLFRTPNPKSTTILLDNILKYTIDQNAYTSKNCICVTFDSVYKNVEQSLKNVTDMLNRRFTKEQIAREIEIVKHEINMYKDIECNERQSAYELLIDTLMDDTNIFNLDILGTTKTLNMITPELLSNYMKRYFNLDNLIISVTTNKSLDNVVELCNKHIFPSLKPASKPEYIIPTPNPLKFKDLNALVAVPNMDSQNVSICLLLRERSNLSEDINLEYAYDVIEEYLMNNMGSILWDVLREKNQLVYNFSLSNLDYTYAKFKAFQATTTTNKMRKTIAEVCKAIRNIGLYGVPPKKFNDVKKALTDIRTATLNKYRAYDANQNFITYLHGDPFVDYKKVNDYIQNMTLEDFNNHIMQIYSTANVSLAVEGKFDSRKCYNLPEVEKMLGNYSSVGYEQEYNLPKIETSPIPDPNLQALEDLANKYLIQKQQEGSQSTDTFVTMDNEKTK